ncbi:MAG: hypothetical protein ACREQN_00900 [Candidatus Binataceae bacterium]
MKIRAIFLAAIIGSALSVVPAFAQNYSPQAESHLQNFMSNHPELQADPSLMTNQHYLKQHPNFAKWLKQHPNAKNEALYMGAYDNGHNWHNSNWWYGRDHDWMQHQQPAWEPNHASWAGQGDWDKQHQWRDRDWWSNNNRQWAEQHHPNWYKGDNGKHDNGKHDNGKHNGWKNGDGHGHDHDQH